VTPEIAEELELADAQGALVSKVIEPGPAHDAGIETMDVIREFDGKPVDDYDDLPRIVAETPVDKKVEIAVIRDGKRVTLRPRIARLEEPELQRASVTPTQGTADDFGLRVQDLTKDLAEQLGLEDQAHGVVVSAVDPSGPAAEAGIRRGDVIIEVDRHEVTDAGDLEKVLGDADDRALMLIRRGENQLYMTVKRSG
jgi:serine protease Do